MYPETKQHTDTVVEELEARLPALLNGPASSCVVIAIDGRCASGKTTLANALSLELTRRFPFHVNIFHMDDFYLRPEQRTEERYLESGGNVDRERFLEEVLLPLRAGLPFDYRPFDCRTMEFASPVHVEPAPVSIVEGSYSLHPALRGYYDFRIFMTVSPEEQLRRIIKRSGLEKLIMFKEKWIPFEERYFRDCRVEEACSLVLR